MGLLVFSVKLIYSYIFFFASDLYIQIDQILSYKSGRIFFKQDYYSSM